MRTIAICEDVDKGQSDIKKLRKENDHLKREIWGLRDECEKLEEILKKVCISTNIPEFKLDDSKNNQKEDDDDVSDNNYQEEPEDDTSSNGGSNKLLNISSGSERKRKESVASMLTLDSDGESCLPQMFGDDPGGGDTKVQVQETIFTAKDLGSLIMNPGGPTSTGQMMATELIFQSHTASDEPVPSTSFAHSSLPSRSYPIAVSSDLDGIREETESVISSNLRSSLTTETHDPSLSLPMLPQSDPLQQENTFVPDDRKTPVIHITPASLPASYDHDTGIERQTPIPTEDVSSTHKYNNDSFHNIGCVTVVPKTFKVTSEIAVGISNEQNIQKKDKKPPVSNYEKLQMRMLETSNKEQDSSPLPMDHIILNQDSFKNELLCHQRRSCYIPANGGTARFTQTLPESGTNYRGFGMQTGCSTCCCGTEDLHLLEGYQSEPTLNHSLVSTNTNCHYFNPLQCCRVGPSTAITAVPSQMTVRSVWNTVDKNIVIGFYGVSLCGGDCATGASGIEPKAQEVVDELEAQFDPTLENIQGIRLIPGRIFISMKNASLVQSFLSHFKNDMFLQRKNTQKLRIHFVEGATRNLTTILTLSGIPQEINDLTVISSLNQFGQVVAPLQRENYKGVDISERTATMHLVLEEVLLPETINITGYTVRIRVKKQQETASASPIKYDSVTSSVFTSTASASVPVSGAIQSTVTPAAITSLKPHKPVIRSSSSAPRLETYGPGTLTCPLPSVEQKRQSSVCVGNIPPDQHPFKILENQQIQKQNKTTDVQHALQQSTPGSNVRNLSTPNLQSPSKKPLARLLVSSPGSFNPSSPPVSSPISSIPVENLSHVRGSSKTWYRHFDPRRVSIAQGNSVQPPLTPSSSYSQRGRRKSSLQYTGNMGNGEKKEPLPWCGCWGLGCGNNSEI